MVQSLLRCYRDESGIALPLALLGLVSVSLLVTTALVTSSTELAISAAHEDATSGLYQAEGGLQAYVAENGTVIQNAAGTTFDYTPPQGDQVSISVTALGSQTLASQGGGILRLFAVTSTPADGGRTVSALVSQMIPPPVPLNPNITSALTLGSNLDVDGNAFSVSGDSQDPSCGPGVMAARTAGDVQVEANNQNHLDKFTGVDSSGQSVQGAAAIEETTLTEQELALDVLGGTLEDLLHSIPAENKWGPMFTPEGQPLRQFDGVVDDHEMVAVIDANGGMVEIEGGSGVVIVVNGSVEMNGTSTFDGIIIVEGGFWLHGTPDVNGALISLSYSATNVIDVDESEIDGNVTVQYDRCQIASAANKFGQVTQGTLTPIIRVTTGWLEVVN